MALVLLGFFFVYGAGKMAENLNTSSAQFRALPDSDYRQMAEEYWAAGQKEAALACLEYIISNNLPDSPASKKLYDKYLAEIRSRTSASGRLAAFGKGFFVSKIDGVDALAGAVTADFLVYGDIRDIVNEGFVKDEGDNFVLTMAGLGLATTIFPPADSSVSLVKVLAKTNSISKPLQKIFLKTANQAIDAAKNSSKTAEAAAEIKSTLMPVYELSKETKTWSQFSSIMKYADSVDDIKATTKFLKKSPDNARKLEQILILTRDRASSSFYVVMRTGQLGMDKIYSVLRKGPKGLAFISRHPVFSSRMLKNAPKAYSLAIIIFTQEIAKNIFIKYFSYAILSALLVLLLVSPRSVAGLVRSQKSGALKVFSYSALFYFVLIFFTTMGAFCADYLILKKSDFDDISENAALNASEVNRNIGLSTWTVRIKIDEDHLINESFESVFCAPLVKIASRTFVVCHADLLGLNWSESAKGGVFDIDFDVSRRGFNPISFVPSKIFLLNKFDGIVLIEVPRQFAQEYSLLNLETANLPESEHALVFKQSYGLSTSSPELLEGKGFFRFDLKAGAEAGDIIATTPSGYFAGVVCAPKKGVAADQDFVARVFAEDLNSLMEVSVKKLEGETYYKDFCESVKKFWESKK